MLRDESRPPRLTTQESELHALGTRRRRPAPADANDPGLPPSVAPRYTIKAVALAAYSSRQAWQTCPFMKVGYGDTSSFAP